MTVNIPSSDIVQYGERVIFLPPYETVPSLTLSVAHFIGMKYLPSSRTNETIQFSLDPLVAMCRQKIQTMISMTLAENTKQPQFRRRCSDADDFANLSLSTNSTKRIKLDSVCSTDTCNCTSIHSSEQGP
jgi:hypothetical protein